jgi:large subunit ribosomal protein L3
MRLGIVGKKIGMTQIFDTNGMVVPITVIDTSDCFITQVKTKEKDGYSAIQVGLGFRKPQNANKATQGHFKKASVPVKLITKEIRVDSDEQINHLTPGKQLTPTMFIKGDKVDVTGISRGKGFQGVIKRWGFHGTDASHGGHKYYRHGGSNGSNTFPGKVLKNKGMPGQTGNVRITTSNLEVADINVEGNLIYLKGCVPGSENSFIEIRTSKRSKNKPKDRSWVAA